jgi:hypothetical protein
MSARRSHPQRRTSKRRGGRTDIEFYNPTMVTRTYRERVANEGCEGRAGRATLDSLTVMWSDPQLHVVDVVMQETLLGERYARCRKPRVPYPCYAKVDVARLRGALHLAESVLATVRGSNAPMPPTREGVESVEERWAEWAKTLKAVIATMHRRRWQWVAVGTV